MRFLIYGTGAVGSYLGGRLAYAGQEVIFLARPPTAEVLRRSGLRLEEGSAARTVSGLNVITEIPPGLDLGPGGAVLLCVRAFDCATAAAALRDRLRGRTRVVCLVNGIGNEETLAEAVGRDRVVAATLTTAVSVRSPGVVRVDRRRGLGVARAGADELLVRAFRDAGLAVRRYDDAAAMKWSKLPTNIVANASSAILDWTAGAVMAHPGVYRLELEALREVFRVMRRSGLEPVDLPGVPVRWLARGLGLPSWASQPFLSRAVAGGRGARRPPLHRDLGLGRSEVHWLNGAVVESGRQHGVPTPANAVLLATMLDLVESRADPAAWRGRADRLLNRARELGVPGIRNGGGRTP